MRDLSNFRMQEWMQLIPVRDAWKQGRNDLWQAAYDLRRAEEQGRFLAEVKGYAGKDIGLVIAFEQPWALAWQLRMAQRHLPDVQMMVFDNSIRDALREQIAEVCRQNDVPYLALPKNSTRHVNRSHGMAMNWVFHNVVRLIEPRRFAFIDHDMIPVRPSRLLRQLDDQPLYGLPTYSPWSWQLWAGYCAFDYAYLADKPVNFLYDFSNGLDTGGRNWNGVYRDLDPANLRLAADAYIDTRDPEKQTPVRLQIVDGSWFHIGGISYNNIGERKSGLCERLARAMDEGASWCELCPDAITAAARSLEAAPH